MIPIEDVKKPAHFGERVRRKRAKVQKEEKVGKVVKDTFNAHVPDSLRDDTWKDTAELMYNRNTM